MGFGVLCPIPVFQTGRIPIEGTHPDLQVCNCVDQLCVDIVPRTSIRWLGIHDI